MDFADNTKLHGPRYTSDLTRPRYERLVIKKLKNMLKESNCLTFEKPKNQSVFYLLEKKS